MAPRTLLNNPLVGGPVRGSWVWNLDVSQMHVSDFRFFAVLATVEGWESVLRDCPGVFVVVEAQVDEPPEVDRGDP